MLRWIGNALNSSVGKKIVMGLTGLLLVGFLVEHLHGNLKLYEGDGTGFNEYVEFLQGFGPLLVLAELGLVALFLCHIFLALRLTLENRQARKHRYAVRNNRGKESFGSVSMFATGALILGYLIKHLIDYRFADGFFDDPKGAVANTLSQPGNAVIYMIAAVVLGVHLSHGFRSAFQSIGASHPKLDAILDKAGIAVAVFFAVGFGSFPVYYLFFWSPSS